MELWSHLCHMTFLPPPLIVVSECAVHFGSYFNAEGVTTDIKPKQTRKTMLKRPRLLCYCLCHYDS